MHGSTHAARVIVASTACKESSTAAAVGRIAALLAQHVLSNSVNAAGIPSERNNAMKTVSWRQCNMNGMLYLQSNHVVHRG